MNEVEVRNDTRQGLERPAVAARSVTPPVDIFERGEGFVILVDLPGVQAQGLTVEVHPPELHLRAEVPGGGFVYERRFHLGSSVDPASIKAELKHGVLTVELAKSAALRPRRIDVRVS